MLGIPIGDTYTTFILFFSTGPIYIFSVANDRYEDFPE